jgi:hypothetical protein
VSFRTKLYGLVFSVPVPAIFGAEFGAIAGAAGYAVMNLVIFGYVLYYSRAVFGRIPIEPKVATALTVGLGVSFALTTGAVAGLTRAGLSPIVVASVAAVTCLVGFGGFLVAVSTSARLVAVRAATLWRSRARSLFG